MEMPSHASSSIELRLGSYRTNSEICIGRKFVDSIGECWYVTYVSNINIIYECQNKSLYGLLVNIWK